MEITKVKMSGSNLGIGVVSKTTYNVNIHWSNGTSSSYSKILFNRLLNDGVLCNVSHFN